MMARRQVQVLVLPVVCFFLSLSLSSVVGFLVPSASTRATATATVLSQSSSSPTREGETLFLDTVPDSFRDLFGSIINATTVAPSRDESATIVGAHDPFRYEWGTWVVPEHLEAVLQALNTVRLADGIYRTMTCDDDDDSTNRNRGSTASSTTGRRRRVKIASGAQWDCFLHALPVNECWQGAWPTGSWIFLKSLTGVVEVASMRGPDRDGLYSTKTKRSLRGGATNDDTILSSGAAGASFGGEDAVKYLGGALRRYSGRAGKTVVMEVVIRPPIKFESKEIVEQWNMDLDETFTIVKPEEQEKVQHEKEEEPPVVVPASAAKEHLGKSMGMSFDKVGGLDQQLDAIARRVLASRANPEKARRLGISHVRGILLSGPPGCGKTLLARELAHLLGAREPQIVNGPEILDKFIGEAEKRVRDLFGPAEREYREVGDASALHIIILDEMDAIARKRGSMSSDTTGVRDSVVNQLLAKMDGVKEANNVLVVGLTNRPELLDPALLRPGRLEVQLRVELPDLPGRRDILRIHTRRMRDEGVMSQEAMDWIEDLGERGLPARTEHFSGAELAGLVRSAASFSLARSVEDEENDGVVAVADLEGALKEVVPALGKQDETLKMRYPFGISSCSPSTMRVMRDLERFVAPLQTPSSRLQSLLLVGSGGNGGAGATALGAWAATQASTSGAADYVRFLTALDLLDGTGGGDAGRAVALVEKFGEAKEMQHSMLVLDDVDQLCAGTGPNGYSSVLIATLRALLRTPPQPSVRKQSSKTMQVIATTSRSDAACLVLHELFDETIVVPLLSDAASVEKLLSDSPLDFFDIKAAAKLMIERLKTVGCKTALRLAELAMTTSTKPEAHLETLSEILDDLAGDELSAQKLCELL